MATVVTLPTTADNGKKLTIIYAGIADDGAGISGSIRLAGNMDTSSLTFNSSGSVVILFCYSNIWYANY
jgi:hypothetical protein